MTENIKKDVVELVIQATNNFTRILPTTEIKEKYRESTLGTQGKLKESCQEGKGSSETI